MNSETIREKLEKAFDKHFTYGVLVKTATKDYLVDAMEMVYDELNKKNIDSEWKL